MSEGKQGEKIALVMGVLGEDTHAVFNEILEKLLKGALIDLKGGGVTRFDVRNVGTSAPMLKFVETAVEVKARVILVSSLYGHAEQDCRLGDVGMREECRKIGLKDVLLYIGGNLGVGKQNPEEIKLKFKEFGFDRVYPTTEGTTFCSTIRQLFCDLKEDLDVVKITIPKEEAGQ